MAKSNCCDAEIHPGWPTRDSRDEQALGGMLSPVVPELAYLPCVTGREAIPGLSERDNKAGENSLR